MMIMETTINPPKRSSKVLKWLLILGIVIILNLFFAYAIKIIYPAPTFEGFCPKQQVTIQPENQTDCVAKGGAWQDYGYPVAPGPVSSPAGIVAKTPTGYCNLNFTCQKQFDSANGLYNRNVFVALVVLGVLSLVAGFFIQNSVAVSLGLSLGGVLSLVIGSTRYWSDMNDYLRVIILGLALIVLIALGIKKVRD